jgi:hypothetical protein
VVESDGCCQKYVVQASWSLEMVMEPREEWLLAEVNLEARM